MWSVTNRRTRSESKAFYRFADFSLCVAGVDEEALSTADSFLSQYYFTRVATLPTDEAHYTLRLAVGARPPRIPSGARASAGKFGSCYTDGDTSYLALNGSCVVVHPPPLKSVEVWAVESHGARESLFSLYLPMSFAIQAAWRRCGLFDLHAAAVVEPWGATGALLIGDSGRGKSTLTLRLAAGGWNYLSDDALLLSKETGAVKARGLRRLFTVAAPPAKLPRFAEALRPSAVLDRDKLHLDPHVLFPGGYVESCTPRRLFFLSIVDSATSWVAGISPRDGLRRLIGLGQWANYDTSVVRDHFQMLELLVKQSACYVLNAGRDLLQDGERASVLLKPLMIN